MCLNTLNYLLRGRDNVLLCNQFHIRYELAADNCCVQTFLEKSVVLMIMVTIINIVPIRKK